LVVVVRGLRRQQIVEGPLQVEVLQFLILLLLMAVEEEVDLVLQTRHFLVDLVEVVAIVVELVLLEILHQYPHHKETMEVMEVRARPPWVVVAAAE
jgi:hypothetical protein